MGSDRKTWKMEALTTLWTGDAQRKGARLVTTGLLGSIRWWFEVVVRGLSGSPCDPSHHPENKPGPCPESTKRPDGPGHHCVVCELFGCTRWARKFRFDALTSADKPHQDQITPGFFQLRFTPLRPICEEEWALLHLTLRLIAEYGAVGGRTVYKPSDELALADAAVADFNDDLVLQRQVRGSPLNQNDRLLRVAGQAVTSLSEVEGSLSSRPTGGPVEIEVERNGTSTALDGWFGKRHHQDHGLIRIEHPPAVESVSRKRLEAYVADQRWRRVEHGDFAWASLRNFWSIDNKYLTRAGAKDCSFNVLLGRKEDKAIKERKGRRVIRWSDLFLSRNDDASRWLAGGRAESKKVFSFKDPESARRTFGFVQSADQLDEMRQRLREKAWDDLDDDEFATGGEILHRLLGKGETG